VEQFVLCWKIKQEVNIGFDLLLVRNEHQLKTNYTDQRATEIRILECTLLQNVHQKVADGCKTGNQTFADGPVVQFVVCLKIKEVDTGFDRSNTWGMLFNRMSIDNELHN
jgi:hypothetical protein